MSGNGSYSNIPFEPTDWDMHRNFVAATKMDSKVAVINVDNARVSGGTDYIKSGFIESAITTPELMLFSTGTGTIRYLVPMT